MKNRLSVKEKPKKNKEITPGEKVKLLGNFEPDGKKKPSRGQHFGNEGTQM